MLRKKTQTKGGFWKKAKNMIFFIFSRETKKQISVSHEKKKERFFLLFSQKCGALFFISLFLFSAFGPSVGYFFEKNSSFGYEQAAAAEEDPDIAERLGQLASFIVSLFTPLVSIEVGVIGLLMTNDFIMGDGNASEGKDITKVEDIGEFLNYIWQVIRNLVNYAFIVVLLLIAFMTVVTAGGNMVGGESAFEIKKILPKFVVAVVLVNFTWFGAKVILDVATVATHIVYSIPQSLPGSILPNADEVCKEDSKSEGNAETYDKCMKFIIGMDIKGGNKLENIRKNIKGGKEATGGNCEVLGSENKEAIERCTTMKDALIAKKRLKPDDTFYVYDSGIIEIYQKKLKNWNDFSAGTVPGIFAFSVLKIQKLPLSDGYEKDIWQVTVKGIVALLIMIIILSVFTVMFFVLLERVIVIWINIILSPVLVLLWVLKDTPLSVEMGGDESIIGFKAFVKSAFAPAAMGIPLMFGLLLIMISQQVDVTTELVKFNVVIKGVNTLIDGIENIHQLFFYIMALGSMWVSMKFAESAATIVKPLVQSIKGGVEGVGKFIAKSPIYLPFFPLATGKDGASEPHSAAELFRLPSLFEQQVRGDTDARARRILGAESAMNDISEAARDSIKKADHNNKLGEFLDKLKENPENYENLKRDYSLNDHGENPSKFVRAIGEHTQKEEDARKIIEDPKLPLTSASSASANNTGGNTTNITLNVNETELRNKTTFQEQVDLIVSKHQAEIDAGKSTKLAEQISDMGVIAEGKNVNDLKNALEAKKTSSPP